MKRIYTLIIFSAILFSCKKEISQIRSDHFLQNVKASLKDSLLSDDYIRLDFSKTTLNRVDSAGLYFLRIPFTGKSLATDFVLVKTSWEGIIEKGKIVHLEGKETEYGEGKVKRRKFDGAVSIHSLNRKFVLNSSIDNGYITAFHPPMNSRDQTAAEYGTDVLPEVVVVAYVHTIEPISFSTWYLLNSFLSNGDGGGGMTSGYYGSAEGGGGSSYYDGGGGGSGTYGGVTGDSYSGVSTDPIMLVDVDTYIDHPAIDVNQILKCFDNIPDDGATCSIEILTDIPVDSDPSKLFNWNTQSPGHTFLQLKKSNGTQFVQHIM